MASLGAADTAILSLNPAECESRQVYKLMTGIIVPRPVALVSTVDRNGAANLAPFSFFTGVGSNPPTVLFCPVVRSRSTIAETAINKHPTLGLHPVLCSFRRASRKVQVNRSSLQQVVIDLVEVGDWTDTVRRNMALVVEGFEAAVDAQVCSFLGLYF